MGVGLVHSWLGSVWWGLAILGRIYLGEFFFFFWAWGTNEQRVTWMSLGFWSGFVSPEKRVLVEGGVLGI